MKYRYKVTRRVTVSTVVEVTARSRAEADEKLDVEIGAGLTDVVEVVYPEEDWDLEADETSVILQDRKRRAKSAG